MDRRVPVEKVIEDIKTMEEKKKIFYETYPKTYQEIAKKYKISMQYVFKIRNKMANLKTYPKVNGK